MTRHDPSSYPTTLRLEVRRAAHLAHSLSRFVERVTPEDPSFFWALGRADEVRAVVGAVVREWGEGRTDVSHAADRIRSYVRDIEDSLESFVRSSQRVAAARAERPRSDTIIDA